jgi:CheY-like chemotaxis protein
LRILIVDDDPLLLTAWRAMLDGDGHDVATAGAGQAAIDLFAGATARGERFAVVITDLGMPYVDGRRVANAIKAASADTPVILLTGWGRSLVADDDVPAGVDRVLSKPPKLAELVDAAG